MTKNWPFGKPSEIPMQADRQYHEDSALRLKHSAEDKLTPTGRLRRRVDPIVFKGLTERAAEAIKGLIDLYPEAAEDYQRWLKETEVMASKVK